MSINSSSDPINHNQKNQYIIDEDDKKEGNTVIPNFVETPNVVEEVVDKSSWFKGALTKEESDKAYAIMASKKGSIELANGDVVHNGRILKGGDAQMTKSLAPLSPGLTIILKGLTSYIQLTVFDEEWLIKDQKAWSTRTTLIMRFGVIA